MNEIKDNILSDAIEAYFKAEIKIARLKIAVLGLSAMCIILIALLIMRCAYG